MLSEVFGYDKYSEITSELCIRGAYCDLATKLDGKTQALIEVKATGTELKDPHVRQAVDYAANAGVEWVVLTNSVHWRIYRVLFHKPIDQELVLDFDWLALNPKKDEDLEMLFLLAKEGWDRSALEAFDNQRQALSRFSLAAVLLSETMLRHMRRRLRKMSPEVKVTLEDIKTVLAHEVLKRDVIEGDKAEEAQKRISRAENRARKLKRIAARQTAVTDLPAEEAGTPITS
jgi:hypothetical protein